MKVYMKQSKVIYGKQSRLLNKVLAKWNDPAKINGIERV